MNQETHAGQSAPKVACAGRMQGTQEMTRDEFLATVRKRGLALQGTAREYAKERSRFTPEDLEAVYRLQADRDGWAEPWGQRITCLGVKSTRWRALMEHPDEGRKESV